MESAEDLINEISEIKIEKKVKKPKKIKKKQDISKKKEYVKKLILDEKKINKSITHKEIAHKIGESVELIDEIHNEIVDATKDKEIKKASKKKFSFKNFKFSFLDKEDKFTLKEFISKIILVGVPLNFAMFVVFHLPFNFYSWAGWGILFWFIKKEGVNIVRSMWVK